ncbi:MAG: response regulator, partial [Deltaproteobacteria bacterium]|nr:response regulator [Deltaproteobacteria bacterium]
ALSGLDQKGINSVAKQMMGEVSTKPTMPNMTGDKLAGEVMKIRPHMPIILCTGFSARISEKRAEETGIRAFIMKPLLMRDLADVVRSVL